MGQLPEKFKLERMISIKESNEIKVRRFLSLEEKKIIGRMGGLHFGYNGRRNPLLPSILSDSTSHRREKVLKTCQIFPKSSPLKIQRRCLDDYF